MLGFRGGRNFFSGGDLRNLFKSICSHRAQVGLKLKLQIMNILVLLWLPSNSYLHSRIKINVTFVFCLVIFHKISERDISSYPPPP